MKIRKIFKYLGLVLLGTLALTSCSDTKYDYIIYCSPDGNPEASGDSAGNPTSFGVALVNAKPGSTILLEGGTYKYNSRIQITRSGKPNKYITVMPKNDKDVIFDFSEMFFDGTNRGIQIYGDFWHFKNISICGAGDNGMYVAGSYNIIEECMFYNNRDTGLQLGRGYSSETSINEWPSYNLIKNCTSFANYDAETLGENADGFACKLTAGYGNVFDGCIAFRNSDDGWDLYAKEDSGNIGTVILYNCVSFENGYLPYQIDRKNDTDGSTYKSYNTMNGDGIGFKLGGSVMEGDVLLNNCIAFNNKLHGFGDNSNPGVIDIRNCTAFNNCIELNEDGTVGGRDTNGGKSNNFDLARGTSGSSNSYNNYYGLLSYINNQENFSADVNEDDASDVELTYNEDKFRGSAAYSIFNTGYTAKGKEQYVSFTAPEDASVYKTKTNDIAFSTGTAYTGLSDSSFASLASLNVRCESVDKLRDLLSYHESLRNEDGSVNLGDLLKVVDPTLLTYANGQQIGANLSKSSYEEYEHYDILDFSGCTTAAEVRVQAAYNVTEVLCAEDSVFQDFEVPAVINGCNITWESSNEAVIYFKNEEKVSVSDAIFKFAEVNTPDKDTEVTLTATITYGDVTKQKTFKLIVKSRSQSMGEMVNSGASSIMVPKFGTYVAPRVYPLDISAIGTRELAASLYDIKYTYEFAESKASTFYPVSNEIGVNTAVPGVYKVTATATSKIENDKGSNGKYKTSSVSYYVYILDPDCDIDFMEDEDGNLSSITLTDEGFSVGGNLSNLYGDMYAVYSATPLTLTAEELIAYENVQKIAIEADSVSLAFTAGDLADSKYYGYYVVANKNKSKLSQVYSFETNVIEVNTEAEFNELASTGKIGSTSAKSTTIYKLTKDLDYSSIKWNVPTDSTAKLFSGLFNGDGHTIKNISIEASGKKNINIFFKVKNGTIINTNFENISIVNTNSTDGKQVGIIGELQGGYVSNVRMKNISAKGKEGVAALIGQVSGNYNYISNCELINDENQVISASNKYAGGIIGNAQINSDLYSSGGVIYLEVTNCSVVANIGDGNDAGGNTGGILGRAKNDYTIYTTKITNCYFRGVITSKGQYGAGIVGDFDNGKGYVSINGCFADVSFVYDNTKLDINDITNMDDQQKYAHKNMNPIVGRAVSTADGVYECKNNLGTWTEYYSTQIDSTSILFDMSYVDEETNELIRWEVTENFLKNIGFDLENTWTFSNGKLSLK